MAERTPCHPEELGRARAVLMLLLVLASVGASIRMNVAKAMMSLSSPRGPSILGSTCPRASCSSCILAAANVFGSARCVGNKLVGHAVFYVVGFAYEHQQRFVLRLPAKARDGAVIAASVGKAGDAQSGFLRGVRRLIRQNRRIVYAPMRPAPKTGVGIRKPRCPIAPPPRSSAARWTHRPTSLRPVTLKRSCTPPSGRLLFKLPFGLRTNCRRICALVLRGDERRNSVVRSACIVVNRCLRILAHVRIRGHRRRARHRRLRVTFAASSCGPRIAEVPGRGETSRFR